MRAHETVCRDIVLLKLIREALRKSTLTIGAAPLSIAFATSAFIPTIGNDTQPAVIQRGKEIRKDCHVINYRYERRTPSGVASLQGHVCGSSRNGGRLDKRPTNISFWASQIVCRDFIRDSNSLDRKMVKSLSV